MANDDHGRGSGPRETPLTFEGTAAPSHAERARTLVQGTATGTLSTLALDPAGHPYGSFVTYALEAGSPVFLISRLAAHTQHLRKDPRASLLAAETHADDPLANGRVTLVGDAAELARGDDASARDAFLTVHPNASYYADFSDFAFWRMTVRTIRYIGGYGRMSWVDDQAWHDASPDPIAPHAVGILEHMNDDHADALVGYARAFTRANEAEVATMTGIDQYGFEMSVQTEKGPRPARVAFDAPIATPDEARKALVQLIRRARAE
ncbi:MAG: HugZ family protein [Sandaracinaceae bacterium]